MKKQPEQINNFLSFREELIKLLTIKRKIEGRVFQDWYVDYREFVNTRNYIEFQAWVKIQFNSDVTISSHGWELKKAETFICSSCNEEWEIGFRYKKGFAPIIDEGGFEAEEMDYYEICGNCHSSAVAGMVASSKTVDVSDLPF